MERWLTQRMAAVLGASSARADGICANVEFPFPRRLIGGALAAASGIDPDSDPWLPERLVWPVVGGGPAQRGAPPVGGDPHLPPLRPPPRLFPPPPPHPPE